MNENYNARELDSDDEEYNEEFPVPVFKQKMGNRIMDSIFRPFLGLKKKLTRNKKKKLPGNSVVVEVYDFSSGVRTGEFVEDNPFSDFESKKLKKKKRGRDETIEEMFSGLPPDEIEVYFESDEEEEDKDPKVPKKEEKKKPASKKNQPVGIGNKIVPPPVFIPKNPGAVYESQEPPKMEQEDGDRTAHHVAIPVLGGLPDDVEELEFVEGNSHEEEMEKCRSLGREASSFKHGDLIQWEEEGFASAICWKWFMKGLTKGSLREFGVVYSVFYKAGRKKGPQDFYPIGKSFGAKVPTESAATFNHLRYLVKAQEVPEELKVEGFAINEKREVQVGSLVYKVHEYTNLDEDRVILRRLDSSSSIVSEMCVYFSKNAVLVGRYVVDHNVGVKRLLVKNGVVTLKRMNF